MKFKKSEIIISLFIGVLILVASCKNNDAIIKTPKSTEKSVSAKTSMEVLKTHFNNDGTLNDTINPVGNILFDFCFEFVYPVTLSYNNDTEVVVQNFDDLIEILVNMTDALFIDGIAFPFDVQMVENGELVTRTITSEEEFFALIDGCIIGDIDECICPAVYDPVCVEVQDPSGENFVVEFPNMCNAECEGFTQDDVVDCGANNPIGGNFSDCFQFVYPFSIVNDEGVAIEVANEDEFNTALFSTTSFEFVFPLDVTQEVNGQIETITLDNNESMVSLIVACESQGCNCPDVDDPVCVASPNGGVIEFRNACFAACEGFTPNDFVSCN